MKKSFFVIAVAAQLSAFFILTPAQANEILDLLGGAPADSLLSDRKSTRLNSSH